MQKGFLSLGLVVILAVAITVSLYALLDNDFLTLNTAPAYNTGTPTNPVPPCPLYNRFFGKCPTSAPTICKYTAPPAGCQYVPGPNYNSRTSCGLVLNCSPSNPGSILCAQDAKICPDGSGVGRTGPNCEFAPCPTSTRNPVLKSGIAGTVTIGPTCPVIQYPSDGACDDRPYQGDFIVKQASGKQLLMASFSTDVDGDYTVNVPPGDYTIQPVETFLSRQVFAVTVKGDLVIEFNFALDSGIR